MQRESLNEWLTKKQYSRSLGDKVYPEKEINRNYQYHNIVDSFDLLIFINKVSATNPIKIK